MRVRLTEADVNRISTAIPIGAAAGTRYPRRRNAGASISEFARYPAGSHKLRRSNRGSEASIGVTDKAVAHRAADQPPAAR